MAGGLWQVNVSSAAAQDADETTASHLIYVRGREGCSTTDDKLNNLRLLMASLSYIFDRNEQWARERIDGDPLYFERLAKQQTPELFWIGCSDSRVSANVIAGLDPGEVFVHRNVANLVYSADLNCMSVLQYAVEVLRVKHVIVCGHYGCGGVRAALEGSSDGLVEHWLEPVKELARQHRTDLLRVATDEARINWLCEANVRAQVQNVAYSPVIRRAWETGQDLTLHGWIYGLENGRLHDLGCNQCGGMDH
jgi:carbonic anhydrase